MTDENIDFEQLVELLDRALTSKDPKVMRALKKFLFIAALATEDTESEGPFRNIMRRIEDLESKTAGGWPGTYTWPNSGSPYWVGGAGPGGGTTTTSSGTAWYQYIPPTTTSGDNWEDLYKSTFTSGTVTCSNAAKDIIDSELNDLEQMAKDSLAK